MLTLMARALRLLAQREHSRAELERKLMRMRPDRGEAAEEADGGASSSEPDSDAAARAEAWRRDLSRTLDELEHGGWLDDRRAAEAVVAARASRYGARRIGSLMRERSFAPELIAQALDPIRKAEPDQARAVWQHRFGRPPVDARDHARQVRFLVGRGFDVSVAADVVRRARSDGLGEPEGAAESTALSSAIARRTTGPRD